MRTPEGEYIIDMSMVCELAHAYTEQECLLGDIKLEQTEENGDIRYTEEAQDVFNRHLELITNILNI